MNDRAVIFDMDGVLIDSYRAHFASWRRMLGRHGIEFSEQQFAETFGQTNPAIISRYWPDHADEQTLADWGDEKERDFRDILQEDFPEMPGAAQLVRSLHEAGMALAIGSSGPTENVRAVLECLPGGELFDAAVTGSDVTHSKPHPEVFLTAAEKLGTPPARCAVVEDAPVGVEAAREAGMAAIALTGTAERARLAEGAHLVVDRLDELTPQRIADLIDGRPG